MADSSGSAGHPLIAELREEGYRFSFFQAVRLLQRLRPDAPRVGTQGPPHQEAVRLVPSLGLAFAASDVEAIRALPPDESGGLRHEITTTFLGLYGTVSPLPVYYTEELLSQDDESLQREFLDLFHHRLLSFFYRAWEKYRYAVQFSDDAQDFFSRHLLTLLGLDPGRGAATGHVPLLRILGLAGLLTQLPHSASTLETALGDYFDGIPVRVESCVDQRLPIPAEQQNRLGVMNCSLGTDLYLGSRVLDRTCTFRVALGPMALEDFLSFLPPGRRLPELRELVDLFNGDMLDYEVELELREPEVPPLRLSGPTALLGWCSWMGGRAEAGSRVRFLVKGWFHGRN